ncbi:3-keto-5-aminohexanoate cleavage protein [Limibacillus sp. MBR-115]|jgi:uncharacterized protein (DUF849 family)|uniref:3-keto-5-aminohexanoate cleavage protein n=1 Tax=Limibacillus sp. MBR-115 TaxID=3156465 RepID=UPI0033925D96
MNRNPFITCALTGSGETAARSQHVPVTPKEIAESGLAAAKAGAAILHIHVRDPKTKKQSRKLDYYREVIDRIRDRNSDVILNLTGGAGGDLVFGQNRLLDFAEGTDFVPPAKRMEHILALKPEIASLDCGSLNFGELLYATTPSMLRTMAEGYREAGVLPELEVFELGHIEMARQLIVEGLITEPPLFQLCLGIKYGAPATPDAMMAMRNALPPRARWAGFGLGRMQFPMVAQACILGGNIRVGLEDNLYLAHGELATNEQLVTRAVSIVQSLGGVVATAKETRGLLGLG